MRYIYLLLITFIFASCGNQKMHFYKVKTKTQEAVKVDKETRASIKLERKSKPEKVQVISENIPVETASKAIDEVKIETKQVNAEEPEIHDLVREKQPSDDEKVTQALEAEKNASRAMWLLVAGLPGSFLILPGLILIIFGGIYYRKAKNAQYISEKGKKRLETARPFLIADIVICSLLSFALIMVFLG